VKNTLSFDMALSQEKRVPIIGLDYKDKKSLEALRVVL
jgi:hypothetical protein